MRILVGRTDIGMQGCMDAGCRDAILVNENVESIRVLVNANVGSTYV